MASVIPPSMMAGFKEGTRTYGLLLDYLEVAIINRFHSIADIRKLPTGSIAQKFSR